MPGQTYNVVGPDGEKQSVGEDALAGVLAHGYRLETTGEGVGRAIHEGELDRVDTPADTATALLAGIGRTASLGLTDVLANAAGGRDYLRDIREAHPTATKVGQVIGMVPMIEAGAEGLVGDLSRATPAGIVSNIGAKIAGLGEEAGTLGKIATTAGAGAFEGAAQDVGSYVSDVALGDRDLSADGFLGAMGKGALYGGVAGGALATASHGLMAARKLLPSAELAPEAVAAAEDEATRGLQDSLDGSTQLESTARTRLQQIREEKAAGDLEFRAQMNKVKLRQAEMAADAQGRRIAAREGAAATKPATDWLKQFSISEPAEGAQAGAAGAEVAPLKTSDIPNEALLSDRFRTFGEAPPAWATPATDADLMSGAALKRPSPISGKEPVRPAFDWRTGKPFDAVENELNAQAAKADPEAAALHDATLEMQSSRDDLMSLLQGTKAGLDKGQTLREVASQPKSIGDQILEGAKPPPTIDEQISQLLTGKTKDVNEDIAKVAPAITRFEAAQTQLTDALGAKAPPEAVAQSQAFRAAKETQSAKLAQGTAQATDHIDQLLAGAPPKQLPGGKSLLGKLGDIGSGYETLRMMGVPLPDPKHVPVIGPLLSLYLKAKVVGKAAKMLGGSFAATAEGTIAAKAAATQNRINSAIDSMLTPAAKAAAKAAPLAGQPAAALGHKLFDDGKKAPYSSDPASGELGDMYRARAAQLTAAMKPGAIERAIRARIVTSDPSITNAIVAAETRKLQYLFGTMPKPDSPWASRSWMPSKAELETWSTQLAAAHDPAAVFERVAAGGTARPEEIDTVQACFPSLYGAGQKRVVEKFTTEGEQPSFARSVAASMAWGIPLTQSMTPDYMAFLQSGSGAAPSLSSTPPASPTLHSSITLGEQTLTRLDR